MSLLETTKLVCIQFMQDAVAASQTDVQLPISEVAAGAGNAVDGVTMPFSGEIVAVTYNLTAAATAGSLTIGATVNGTEKTDTTQTVTTGVGAVKKVPREKVRFNAGDKLGVEITTSGTWDGTSSDLGVWVWALLNSGDIS